LRQYSLSLRSRKMTVNSPQRRANRAAPAALAALCQIGKDGEARPLPGTRPRGPGFAPVRTQPTQLVTNPTPTSPRSASRLATMVRRTRSLVIDAHSRLDPRFPGGSPILYIDSPQKNRPQIL
jgi:hypothetical protein